MENDVIATLIATAPNLLVALWVIWRDDKRVTQLLIDQKWLIEQLMAMHPPQPDPQEDDEERTREMRIEPKNR